MFGLFQRFHLHKHFLGIDNALTSLIKRRLWLQILIGLFLGVCVGVLLSQSFDVVEEKTARIITEWLAIPGNLFLTIIQMIIVPLIIASVILGIGASESLEQLKKMGWRIIFYFILTTSVAIGIGLTTANILKPGTYLDQTFVEKTITETPQSNGEKTEIDWETIPTKMINVLPSNPTESIVRKEMLQIVLFAIIFGIALVTIPSDQAKPLYRFFEGLQAVTLKIVNWVMKIAPLAVFGLMAQIISKTGIQAFLGIGMYIATVLLALLGLLVFYLLLVWVFGKKNPFHFLANIREAQLLAFSTSSSAAVMPLSLKVATEKLKVQRSVSEFLIPLGTTINMDGTALYQGVATVFLAQVFQMDLSIIEMGIVLMTSIGASIGTPATPGVGIVVLSTVLTSVGIPSAGIVLIIGVDRILDMCRTALNVTGDLVACVVIGRVIAGRNMVEKIVDKIPFSSKEKNIGGA